MSKRPKQRESPAPASAPRVDANVINKAFDEIDNALGELLPHISAYSDVNRDAALLALRRAQSAARRLLLETTES